MKAFQKENMGRSSALTVAERSRRYREKQRAQLASSSAHKVEKQRAQARARMLRYRESLNDPAKKQRAQKQRDYRKFKHESEWNVSDAESYHVGLTSPYKSLSSAGKALVKARAAFPKDETFRRYVWERIGIEWGYLNKDQGDLEIATNPISSSGICFRDESQIGRIRQFYYRRDVSYTTPGIT